MEYWHVSACPMATFTPNSSRLRLVLGGGIGIDVRAVRVTWRLTDSWGDRYYGNDRLTTTEVSPVAVLLLGADLPEVKPVSVGVHVYFDHHFMGDTSRGAFGDTGGLHLMGSLGYWL